MGPIPKEELAKMKREKREAKAARKRKENTRSRIVRFLIVCEGTKTEPNYFKALIKDRQSEVREIKEEDIKGEGCSTCALVKRALELKYDLEKRRQLPFDRVWVVFDKDEFQDFNDAIRLANSKKVSCAWSNEAFELWYYLHFEYLDTGITRQQYIEKLEREIRKRMDNEAFKYEKNDSSMYALLKMFGNEEFAKGNAIKLRKKFRGNQDYQSHTPCTMVDKLVDELENTQAVLDKISSRENK